MGNRDRNRIRTALGQLDSTAPAEDVFRRALDGPVRPEPGDDPDTSKRVVAAVTALAVFGVAAGFLWYAFRPASPSSDQPATPTLEVATLGEDGTTLWPERTAAGLEELQSRADEGGRFAWLRNPSAVASRFAEMVLGWPERDHTIEDVVEPGDDPALTILRIMKDSHTLAQCPPRPIDRCLIGEELLTLAQPVKKGDGGIWVVTRVEAPSANLDVVPGQIVRSGDEISGGLETTVADGLSSSAGVQIGGWTDPDRNCSTGNDLRPGEGTFRIPVSVEPDAAAGTDCGPRIGGYAWVATATWPDSGGKTGNPLNADSAPYVAVTAVPLVVSIPENESPPGMATYVDPTGWRADYPSDWIVTPFRVMTFGAGLISGAAISNLPLAEDEDGYPDVPEGSFAGGAAIVIEHTEAIEPLGPGGNLSDSSFPLDPADAEFLRGPGPRILDAQIYFRGNGEPYAAAFGSLRASDEDIAALQEVIRSIRFPTLAQGQRANGWESLGPADRYALGEGTATATQSLGVVYVLRSASGDARVLDLEPESCGEGQNQTWDPDAMQIWIECPDGGDIRYDRDGAPAPGNPPGFRRTLDIHQVVVSWDGALLMGDTAFSLPSG